MNAQWNVGDRIKSNGAVGTVIEVATVDRKDWEGKPHPEWSRMVKVQWDHPNVSWEAPELLIKAEVKEVTYLSTISASRGAEC